MLLRTLFLSIGAAVLPLATVPAAAHAGAWKSVEIVSFEDFDDLEVKLDGKPCKAFLVGLRSLREVGGNREEREDIQKEVRAALKESKLCASVVTKKGNIVGLSLDTFARNKHGFDHEWDPEKYPYCATGWGAYNFNLYFLHRVFTTPCDNFGDNKTFKEFFQQLEQKKRSRDPSKK